jgi:hypothetical protein
MNWTTGSIVKTNDNKLYPILKTHITDDCEMYLLSNREWLPRRELQLVCGALCRQDIYGECRNR